MMLLRERGQHFQQAAEAQALPILVAAVLGAVDFAALRFPGPCTGTLLLLGLADAYTRKKKSPAVFSEIYAKKLY